MKKQEMRNHYPRERQSLFNAAWRRYRAFRNDADIDDPVALFEQIISQLVNDSKSQFYIYG